MNSVEAGTSMTYFAGEKYIASTQYLKGGSGDDQTMYIGDDADIRRWAVQPPLPDSKNIKANDAFGSAHPTGCQFVMCDGSVRLVAFSVDEKIHSKMANRRNGN